MRRVLFIPLLLILLGWIISSITPIPARQATPAGDGSVAAHTPRATDTLHASSTPQATLTPRSPTVSQTLEPVLAPTSESLPADGEMIPPTIQLSPGSAPALVKLHPDGGLYVGDQVSFEVILFAPEEDQTTYESVQVTLPDGTLLASNGFSLYGLGRRYQSTMIWAWDTSSYAAGDYALTFTLRLAQGQLHTPGNQTWSEIITLLPQEARPWPEPAARWETAHSQCCTVHYITGTSAERDLPKLLQQADEQARNAVQRMGIEFTQPITITLLPRLLGHGGFASSEISISYLDRNYAGSNFEMVLHHEMIHILDGRLGGDYRPSLFVEGLAVYQTGGHFKPELLMPRAAALLPTETGLGWYIPLADLANDFYLSQHEIGYLEGAALVEYMVNAWGWDAFSSFYRDIHPAEDGLPSTAIDSALKVHFNLTFSELEARFIDALQRIQVTSEIRSDMRFTVEFYDTVRRYQQLLDPSAFFQTAWLLDTASMRQRGIIADYLRHPNTLENVALEALLGATYDMLFLGEYDSLAYHLGVIHAVLTAMERGDEQPFHRTGLAEDVYMIAQVVRQAGYELQRVDVEGDRAQAWGTADGAWFVELTLVRQDESWKITENEFTTVPSLLSELIFSVDFRDVVNSPGRRNPRIALESHW